MPKEKAMENGPPSGLYHCDVAIIGGGPAGASAALSLRQLRPQLRVLVVEASHYDDWRPGETLSPGSQEILRSLGCWDAFLAAGFTPSHGTRALWGGAEPYDNEFLFSLRGSGWHVARACFDALLCDRAREAGAEVLTDARLQSVQREQNIFRLQLQFSEAKRIELHSRFVIDASGRSACFAGFQGAKRMVDDRLLGVCGIFAAAGADAATLVEAQPGGWWYSSLLPASRMIVAWMSDADLIREQGMCDPVRWLERMGRSKFTHRRIGGDLLTPLRAWTAQSQRLSRFCGEGWVAAGDSATTYDPLSSQGILKALRSGKVASFVALDALEGRDTGIRYEEMVAGEYAGYCETKRWFYSQERRWPLEPFWQRRREQGC
jgi:flavin-dependent dehydrogenase